MVELPRSPSRRWPLTIDWTKEECQQNLRALELSAYSSVVSVLRAQGHLSKEKRKLLHDLQSLFCVSLERHRAEVRRAVNDERLNTIAETLAGPSADTEWAIEGRRLVPLMPRVPPQTVYSALATRMAQLYHGINQKMPEPADTGRFGKRDDMGMPSDATDSEDETEGLRFLPGDMVPSRYNANLGPYTVLPESVARLARALPTKENWKQLSGGIPPPPPHISSSKVTPTSGKRKRQRSFQKDFMTVPSSVVVPSTTAKAKSVSASEHTSPIKPAISRHVPPVPMKVSLAVPPHSTQVQAADQKVILVSTSGTPGAPSGSTSRSVGLATTKATPIAGGVSATVRTMSPATAGLPVGMSQMGYGGGRVRPRFTPTTSSASKSRSRTNRDVVVETSPFTPMSSNVTVVGEVSSTTSPSPSGNTRVIPVSLSPQKLTSRPLGRTGLQLADGKLLHLPDGSTGLIKGPSGSFNRIVTSRSSLLGGTSVGSNQGGTQQGPLYMVAASQSSAITVVTRTVAAAVGHSPAPRLVTVNTVGGPRPSMTAQSQTGPRVQTVRLSASQVAGTGTVHHKVTPGGGKVIMMRKETGTTPQMARMLGTLSGSKQNDNATKITVGGKVLPSTPTTLLQKAAVGGRVGTSSGNILFMDMSRSGGEGAGVAARIVPPGGGLSSAQKIVKLAEGYSTHSKNVATSAGATVTDTSSSLEEGWLGGESLEEGEVEGTGGQSLEEMEMLEEAVKILGRGDKESARDLLRQAGIELMEEAAEIEEEPSSQDSLESLPDDLASTTGLFFSNNSASVSSSDESQSTSLETSRQNVIVEPVMMDGNSKAEM